jgi:hypothetical protein
MAGGAVEPRVGIGGGAVPTGQIRQTQESAQGGLFGGVILEEPFVLAPGLADVALLLEKIAGAERESSRQRTIGPARDLGDQVAGQGVFRTSLLSRPTGINSI